MRTEKRISLRFIVLLLTVPVILLSVLAGNLFSYYFAADRMKTILMNNTTNTVTQATDYLETRFFEVFRDFVLLEKKIDLGRITNDKRNVVEDELYLQWYSELSNLFLTYRELLDFACLSFRYEDGRVYQIHCSDDVQFRPYIDFDGTIGGVELDSEQANGYVWTSDEGVGLFKRLDGKKNNVECILYVAFKEQFFAEKVFPEVSDEAYYMVLVDTAGVLFSPVAAENETVRQLEVQLPLELGEKGLCTVQTSQGEYLLAYDTISVNRWKYAALIDRQKIFSDSEQLLSATVIGIVLASVLAFLISAISTHFISVPVKNWLKKVQSLQQDDFDVTFEDSVCTEISQINDGLGYMIEKVDTLLEKNAKESEKKRQLEFKLLQETINPHFLYNTLYSIQELYRFGDDQQAQTMIRALTGFYRRMHGEGREFVTVQEELLMAEDYIQIQQMRHANFRYERYTKEDTAHFYIFRMALQPVVENAIMHGLYEKEDGFLKISVESEETGIVLRVEDNGVGISAPRLKTLRKCMETGDWSSCQDAFGLRNVHERLRLYYGESYGLQLQSELGRGTVVTLHIARRVRE